jgi:hypothetical protein
MDLRRIIQAMYDEYFRPIYKLLYQNHGHYYAV